MKMYNYRRKENDIVASQLRTYLGLPWERKQDIEDFLRSEGYSVWRYVKPVKNNIWWRLTFPFFILLCILMLIAIPFKWMLTGNGKYDDSKGVGKLWCAWNRKLDLV